MKNNKSLFKLTEFWLSISLPFLFSILLGWVIFLNSNFKLDLTYTGFNNLIEFYKLPLGVLALIFPLVALVASNHRSRQSAAQIELSKSQNNFSNFYKHKETFYSMIERLEKKHNVTFSNHDSIYSNIFPKNSPSSITYRLKGDNSRYITEVRDELKKLIIDSLIIDEFKDNEIKKSDLIKAFLEGLHNISERLNFKVNAGVYLCWSRRYRSPTGDIREESVSIEQRKGLHIDEFYVFGHVSLCDDIIKSLAEFCMIEDYKGAYECIGSPIWIWSEKVEIEKSMKSCVKFGTPHKKKHAHI